MKLRYTILVLSLMAFSAVFGCSWLENTNPTGQAAKKAFETRVVDAPYDAVYSAAVESMFDLGYTVGHSDKTTGIVVGEKNQKRYVNTSGMTEEEKRRAENEYDTLQLTILVKKMEKKQTDVRIKSSLNKMESFQKNAIDQVWVYIQRQVMMEEVPK